MNSDGTPIISPAAVLITIFILTVFIVGFFNFMSSTPPLAQPPILSMSHERISNGTYSFKIEAVWQGSETSNDLKWSNIRIAVEPGVGISTHKPASKLIEVNDTITISGMTIGATYEITLIYLLYGNISYHTSLSIT